MGCFAYMTSAILKWKEDVKQQELPGLQAGSKRDLHQRHPDPICMG